MKITMDTEHHKADGHRGTWYSINSCVYRGETFYLMEHEKYGDEVANIAVHENGTLVAEDLWDGFDDGFRECADDFLNRKNGININHSKLKPHIVTVTERYVRSVIVWAEDKCDAEEKAYDFCNDATIDLSYDDFCERDCICKGVAQESALEFYEQYGDEQFEKE